MDLKDLLDHTYETTAGTKTLREILDPARPTVFIATPMDFTPVCTKQMCDYRNNWEHFSKLDCRWWGLNQASAAVRARFKVEKNMPMDLITDPDGELLKRMNLWGMLRTRRGFAVVAPDGETLASTHIFPFFYQKPEEVLEFLKPFVAAAPAA